MTSKMRKWCTILFLWLLSWWTWTRNMYIRNKLHAFSDIPPFFLREMGSTFVLNLFFSFPTLFGQLESFRARCLVFQHPALRTCFWGNGLSFFVSSGHLSSLFSKLGTKARLGSYICTFSPLWRTSLPQIWLREGFNGFWKLVSTFIVSKVDLYKPTALKDQPWHRIRWSVPGIFETLEPWARREWKLSFL